ncbi:DUF6538 domain-containing protein [Pseudomonas putida]|uniref:DUF6538 domain-containing protein n=1 Tax=Pseudomonas putida TaxID=303 RepID=UPI002889CB7A|nr:DUF6538 domain-containing protein [Pseudomonas putida]WNI07708.1 hypothetical protein RIF00_24850 [Pseudomonas putida]
MKPSPSYLTLNRHGTFYFRIVIPCSLRMLFNGQREIRRTLKTDSHRLARKRARQFVARFESAFDKVVSVIERDELGLSVKWTHRSRQFFSEFKLRRLLPLQLVGAAP